MKKLLSVITIAAIASLVSCKKDVVKPPAPAQKVKDAVKPVTPPVTSAPYDYQKAIMAKRTLTVSQ